jgi:superfamily I DNA and/or RNA helicase/very-short-patch-repair endonuclease
MAALDTIEQTENLVGKALTVPDVLNEIRRKLLDLSSRNRLLNFKHSKLGITITEQQPKQAFELLVTNSRPMFFNPIPEPEDNTDQVDVVGADTCPDNSQTTTKRNERCLQTALLMPDLETRLRRIMSKANSVIQETGKNQLFLALGFLKWKEHATADEYCFAPLIMIPVEIKRGIIDNKTRCYRFKVEYTGEDLIPNLSLIEKLKKEFDIALPDFNDRDVLSDDESELDPEKYLVAVSEAVAKFKGWSVNKNLELSFFTFSKLLMYHDLNPSNWPSSPLIERLYSGEDFSALECQQEADNKFNINELPLIVNADSSQANAIAKAVQGHSLVIQGPPGTGKSQTITNLISCFLAKGKTVLFVAEKMAALNVVQKNLELANLGDFCLELHNHKADKQKVIESLHQRWNKRFSPISVMDSRLEELKRRQESLDKYVEIVNKQIGPEGETISEIFWRTDFLKTKLPCAFSISAGAAEKITCQDMHDRIQLLDALASYANDMGLIKQNPWYGYTPSELYYHDIDAVIQSFKFVSDLINGIIEETEKLFSRIALKSPIENVTLRWLLSLNRLESVEVPKNILWQCAGPFLRENAKALLPTLEKFRALLLQYHKNLQQSGTIFAEKVIANDTLMRCKELLRVAEVQNLLNVSMATSKGISESSAHLINLLNRIAVIARNYISSGLSEPHTINDFTALIRIAGILRNKPVFVASGDWDLLFEPEFIKAASEAIKKHRVIESLRKDMEKIFVLKDVPSIETIAKIRQILRQMNGNPFKLFSFKYISARKELYAFLRDHSSARSVNIFQQLELLERLIAEEQALYTDRSTEKHLGSFFGGYNTDWHSLEKIVYWIAEILQSTKSFTMAKKLVQIPDAVEESWSLQRELDSMVQEIESELKALTNYFHNTPALDFVSQIKDLRFEEVLARMKNWTDLFSTIYALISPSQPKPDCLLENIKVGVENQLAANTTYTQIENEVDLKYLLADNFKGINTDIESLLETAAWANNMRELNLPKELFKALTAGNIQEIVGAIIDHAAKCGKVMNEIHREIASLKKFGEFAANDPLGVEIEDTEITRIRNVLKARLAGLDNLGRWADYCRLADKGRRMGVGPIIDMIEGGELQPGNAADAYKYMVYNSLATYALKKHEVLSTFSRMEHESLRSKFIECDKQIHDLRQKEVASVAAKREVPKGNNSVRAKDRTNKWLLLHEFSKTKRHLPIRSLMDRAGEAVQALKPVFMMSPMSVAQFLRPGKHVFDIVIMDEASQLQPHDALGALARSKQMIIVGDPKQLPPTTFFESQFDEVDEEAIFADTDASSSILDVCQSVQLPDTCLKWHYRSEHESLIAFSNARWYENELVIFPSAVSSDPNLGIKFEYIADAAYAAGKNEKEADIVVRSIIDHARKYPDISLGVATFNLKQRELLEDRLNKLSKEDPSIDAAMSNLMKAHDGHEPFFIKNLENLQGDERDVIFISCTFGPDKETGRVLQHFGPINSDNGWRRLNVLFTRAKRKMVVFSSMHPEDIIPEPGKEGRIALRDFLNYARTGQLSNCCGYETNSPTPRDPDSDFELAVGAVLRSSGYKIKPQVGVAGYFIDIGVYHPDRPHQYILGVECDGVTYHSSKYARERDRLREEVLNRRGWEIHRIWSTDWFKNRKIEIERLLNKLKTMAVNDTHIIGFTGESEQAHNGQIAEIHADFVSESDAHRPHNLFDMHVIQSPNVKLAS